MGSLQLNPIWENSFLFNLRPRSLLRLRLFAFGQHVYDLPRKQVAVSARAAGHKIPIDNHVLIGINRTVCLDVAVKIVVSDDSAALHQLWSGRHQPHAVANDSFENALLGESTLQELYRGRNFVYVFGPA